MRTVARKRRLKRSEEKRQILQYVEEGKNLFLGTGGRWKGIKVSIELKLGAKPVQSKPYEVPWAHIKMFKQGIERFVTVGLFTKVSPSE